MLHVPNVWDKLKVGNVVEIAAIRKRWKDHVD
jgi:hypothetical protein